MEFISECLRVNGQGHLAVGGADVVALAKQYGTPLYIMDENQIRNTCRALRVRHAGVLWQKLSPGLCKQGLLYRSPSIKL